MNLPCFFMPIPEVSIAKTAHHCSVSARARVGYALCTPSFLYWYRALGAFDPTVKRIYQRKSELQKFEGIQSYFETTLYTNPLEKTRIRYIYVFISLSLPISYVENDEFSEFSGIDVLLSVRSLRNTILKLVELVELAIRNDLKNTCVAVIHDG